MELKISLSSPYTKCVFFFSRELSKQKHFEEDLMDLNLMFGHL